MVQNDASVIKPDDLMRLIYSAPYKHRAATAAMWIRRLRKLMSELPSPEASIIQQLYNGVIMDAPNMADLHGRFLLERSKAIQASGVTHMIHSGQWKLSADYHVFEELCSLGVRLHSPGQWKAMLSVSSSLHISEAIPVMKQLGAIAFKNIQRHDVDSLVSFARSIIKVLSLASKSDVDSGSNISNSDTNDKWQQMARRELLPILERTSAALEQLSRDQTTSAAQWIRTPVAFFVQIECAARAGRFDDALSLWNEFRADGYIADKYAAGSLMGIVAALHDNMQIMNDNNSNNGDDKIKSNIRHIIDISKDIIGDQNGSGFLICSLLNACIRANMTDEVLQLLGTVREYNLPISTPCGQNCILYFEKSDSLHLLVHSVLSNDGKLPFGRNIPSIDGLLQALSRKATNADDWSLFERVFRSVAAAGLMPVETGAHSSGGDFDMVSGDAGLNEVFESDDLDSLMWTLADSDSTLSGMRQSARAQVSLSAIELDTYLRMCLYDKKRGVDQAIDAFESACVRQSTLPTPYTLKSLADIIASTRDPAHYLRWLLNVALVTFEDSRITPGADAVGRIAGAMAKSGRINSQQGSLTANLGGDFKWNPARVDAFIKQIMQRYGPAMSTSMNLATTRASSILMALTHPEQMYNTATKSTDVETSARLRATVTNVIKHIEDIIDDVVNSWRKAHISWLKMYAQPRIDSLQLPRDELDGKIRQYVVNGMMKRGLGDHLLAAFSRIGLPRSGQILVDTMLAMGVHPRYSIVSKTMNSPHLNELDASAMRLILNDLRDNESNYTTYIQFGPVAYIMNRCAMLDSAALASLSASSATGGNGSSVRDMSQSIVLREKGGSLLVGSIPWIVSAMKRCKRSLPVPKPQSINSFEIFQAVAFDPDVDADEMMNVWEWLNEHEALSHYRAAYEKMAIQLARCGHLAKSAAVVTKCMYSQPGMRLNHSAYIELKQLLQTRNDLVTAISRKPIWTEASLNASSKGSSRSRARRSTRFQTESDPVNI